MVAVAEKPILGKVFKVAHSQTIFRELDGEGSSVIEETRSFIIDLMIDTENCSIYPSTVAYKAGIPISSWYGFIWE